MPSYHTCIKCKKTKVSTEFYPKKRTCKECENRYSKEYYKRNAEDRKRYAQEYRASNPRGPQLTYKSRAVLEFGGKCQVCGYDKCMAALEFHHVDPSTKKYNITTLLRMKWSEITEEELSKCVMVCSNCHMEIHWGATPCPEPHREKKNA